MNYCFFLGGYDLEMAEIKKIILNQGYKEGISVFDLHLNWGARLSSYSEIIQKLERQKRFNIGLLVPKFFSVIKKKQEGNFSIVGIELIKDIECRNYIEIDHHNQNSDKLSSIEQVADLFKLELNRYQLLVAANDKGYIPAMLQMGATRDEITTIRHADRSAQGVTPIEEDLAEQAVATHLSKVNGIVVVKALGNKFSPITDRLYPFDKLLIYNQHELTYYGSGKEELLVAFAGLLQDGKAYHGGGKDGFFGIGSGNFSPNEIEMYVQTILKLLS